MEKLGSFFLLGVSVLAIIIPILSIGISSQVGLIQQTPTSISLIFSYRVGSRNVLNTFEGTYTRDMVVDASITVKMNLNPDELQLIESKLNEIGFFASNYSRLLPGGLAICEATPYSTYYLKVRYDGSHVRELRWSNKVIYSNDSTSLNELTRLITSIIEVKPEYKSLPEPRAGYA